jgi:putative heme-binding domain-containing protein
VQHVVGSSRHWKRNPDLNFSATVQNCPEVMINDLLSSTENLAARIYPISENLTTADSHAGTFSAACGVHVYRGDALAGYYGRVFVCDPTANLVHWDELVPNGATFLARRSTNHSEFLASPDNWFRPVNLAAGPDGALYVCDMYRKTIEHPQYLPEEVRKRTDFASGRDKGRIWRVTARSVTVNVRRRTNDTPSRVFTSAATKGLVGLLGHPDGWQRDTARRLLIERRVTNAVPLLLEQLPKLANESDDALRKLRRAATDPAGPGPHLARMNALNTLFALSGGRSFASTDKEEIARYFRQMQGALAINDAEMNSLFARLIRATLDESPAVRATAFRLLDAFPGEGPEVSGAIHYLWADDPSTQTRFQIALFLGKCEYGDTLPALARIARRDGHDRWTRAAILSGLKGRANHFFDTLLRQTNDVLAPELMTDLCRLDVNPTEAVLALTAVAQRLGGVLEVLSEHDDGWHLAGLAGLLEGLRARRATPTPKLADLADKAFGDQQWRTTPWRADRRSLPGLLSRAPAIAMNPAQPLPVRVACTTVLAHEQGDAAVPMLLQLLTPGQPVELQAAVIRALASLPGDATSRELLSPDRWQKLSPATRTTVLSALLAQPRHVAVLLETLEQERLPLAAVPTAQRNQLVKHKDDAIRQRAEKLFKAAGGDRMKVFEEFKPVLALKANPGNGRTLFKTHCAACHRLDRDGMAVGPDLLGIRNQPKEAILLHVLVPNYEIMPGFAGYQVETADGRELSGLILSETAASITLRQAQGLEETISRTNIKSLTASQLSLMPDGVEQSMTRQELADLIAYLKGEGN